MKVFELVAGCSGLDGLRCTERPDPVPAEEQILVRIGATSLNSRDQAIVDGTYIFGRVTRDLIPLSDGAGEVIGVGSRVTKFKPGDRIVGAFFQSWVEGPPTAQRKALGYPLDGMLAELVVLHEDGAVLMPNHLSYEEGATLPCAGVTAWNALMHAGTPLRSGDTALCLGTGGVSTFGVCFAKALGARAIVTSSTDQKLLRACDLGAAGGLNYIKCKEWGAAVFAQSRGGVNAVLEVGGGTSLRQSCEAVGAGGKIALIGTLGGRMGCPDLLELMKKNASLHGLSVGPRRILEDMIQMMSVNKIRPIIDKVFGFAEAPEAFKYHRSGEFVGKIVIAL